MTTVRAKSGPVCKFYICCIKVEIGSSCFCIMHILVMDAQGMILQAGVGWGATTKLNWLLLTCVCVLLPQACTKWCTVPILH